MTIEIVEVAARDGLQNEPNIFSTAQKIALVERMIAAGARRLEVASFVRADRVPQMADAEAVIAGLDPPTGVVTIGLVLNERGLDRALATSVHEIGAVCVASDSFARANQGQTSRGSARIAANIVTAARAAGRRARRSARHSVALSKVRSRPIMSSRWRRRSPRQARSRSLWRTRSASPCLPRCQRW